MPLSGISYLMNMYVVLMRDSVVPLLQAPVNNKPSHLCASISVTPLCLCTALHIVGQGVIHRSPHGNLLSDSAHAICTITQSGFIVGTMRDEATGDSNSRMETTPVLQEPNLVVQCCCLPKNQRVFSAVSFCLFL